MDINESVAMAKPAHVDVTITPMPADVERIAYTMRKHKFVNQYSVKDIEETWDYTKLTADQIVHFARLQLEPPIRINPGPSIRCYKDDFGFKALYDIMDAIEQLEFKLRNRFGKPQEV